MLKVNGKGERVCVAFTAFTVNPLQNNMLLKKLVILMVFGREIVETNTLGVMLCCRQVHDVYVSHSSCI
jgi:hypothetical protein